MCDKEVACKRLIRYLNKHKWGGGGGEEGMRF